MMFSLLKKIRALKFLEGASGFPRSSRVDFTAEYDSDESEQEEGKDELQKKTEDKHEPHGCKSTDDNTKKETSSRTTDSKPSSKYGKFDIYHKIVFCFLLSFLETSYFIYEFYLNFYNMRKLRLKILI